MDRFILDHTRQSPALERLRQTFIEGDPAALLCVEFYAETAEDLPPRLDALERDLARATVRLSLPSRARTGGAERHLVRSRGRTRPLDGDEGGRQVALVRRGHRGRAGEAARLHREVSRDGPQPRHDGGRLCARLRRMSARAAGRQPEDRGWRPAVRSHRVRQRRSGARVRRGAVRRAWGRPRPQSVHGEDVRAGPATRPSGTSSRRSIPTAFSIQARSWTPLR